MIGFRFALVLDDGDPADPPASNTVLPTWRVGDAFLAGVESTRFRILAIDDGVGDPFDGLWLVEPL